jgi:hypothetical protein
MKQEVSWHILRPKGYFKDLAVILLDLQKQKADDLPLNCGEQPISPHLRQGIILASH